MKIDCLVSHPIQYQSSMFRAAAVQVDLRVLYLCDHGADDTEAYDVQFARNINWGVRHQYGFEFEYFSRGKALKGFFSPQVTLQMLKWIFKGDADVYFVHGWNRWPLFFGIIVLRILGRRLILRTENNLRLYRSSVKNFFHRVFLNFLRSPKCVFWSIGSENKKYYQHFINKPFKSQVTFYSVDMDFWNNGSEIFRIGNKFIFVGKLIPKKNPLKLVKDFQEILLTCESVSLDIIGDGPLRESLEHYIFDNKLSKFISVHGFKDQCEIKTILKTCNFLILDSDSSETWGLVVNEALGLGLFPLIGPRPGCNTDVYNAIFDNCTHDFASDDDEVIRRFVDLDIKSKFEFVMRRRSIIESCKLPEVIRKFDAKYAGDDLLKLAGLLDD